MSHLRVVGGPAAVWSRVRVRAAEDVLLGLLDKSEDETRCWIRSRSPANDHCNCTATSRTFLAPVALPHRSAVRRRLQSLLVDAGGQAPPTCAAQSHFGNTTETHTQETHTHPPTVIIHHQLFPHTHFETRKEGNCGRSHHHN